MKKYLVSLLFMALCIGASAQIRFEPNPAMPLPENIFMFFNANNTNYDGRFSMTTPAWFIYPDGPVSREAAEALVDELGFNDSLKDYISMMVVIGPANGKDYDAKEDFSVYEAFINKIRVFVNLKVVGIGKGATFVNEAIAPIASEVADILCIDGKPAKKIEGKSTVPAYMYGKQAAKAAKAYIARNNAVLKENGKTLKVYENAEEELLKVVVNTGKGSLKDIMADAWERLLSRNYRSSNLGHTGYMGGTLGQYGDYELEPYLMWERLGTVRERVEKVMFDYNRHKETYMWYEYRPAAMNDAAPGSVPLVVLLHGHNNDPRTQAETSGFVELGAVEGFMVAELEWQGKPGYDYMGDHGIEAVIRELLNKYPQLDASRIYAEGLSAGGFTATALGVGKTHLFAAVGAHSGGLFNGSFFLGFPFMNPAALKAEAAQKSGKVLMPYFSICGTADDVVPFLNPELPNGTMMGDAWRLYQKLNGLEVSGPTDLAKYPVFGLPLENRHRIETIKHHAMEVGDVLDCLGRPVIRLVAVENFGHWNFVPGSREMWNFFKQWRRDPETGESVYIGDAPAGGLYIDARGGDMVDIRASKDARPETVKDLAERLHHEKMPLHIKASQTKWGAPLRQEERRKSWGDVVMDTYDFAIKDGDTLRLDVYRQSGYDKPRPIFIYSFGGGWQGGFRGMMDNPIFPFYTPFAKMGYVVVAIDYRLGYAKAEARGEVPKGDVGALLAYSKGTELEQKIVSICRKACLDAVEDLYDATSFVVEHAGEWGGDPSNIVISGGSAGACNSLMAEYLLANEDPMAMERLPKGFRYAGIVPCAGAIFTGGEPISWKRKPAPIMFLHGSADPIVPYAEGYQFSGPAAIVPTLPEQTPYVLYTVKDLDHSMSGIPTGYMNYAIAAFIERYAVGGEQACLTVEEEVMGGDGPLMKQYLLSGYKFSPEEMYKAYVALFGPIEQ